MDKSRIAILLAARNRIMRAAIAIVLAALVAPTPAVGQIATGTYTGDGVDDRAITGVGFQPDVVMIRGDLDSGTTGVGFIRTSTMVGDLSKPWVGQQGLIANGIQSLDVDGFTIGTHNTINKSGKAYYWTAFGGTTVGSYTGDGNDNRSISGLGFQPDYVIIMSAGSKHTTFRTSAMVGDLSSGGYGSQDGSQANRIQVLESNGFQVGTDQQVNQSGVTYHYAAWEMAAGNLSVGSYTGDGSDDRDIAGLGFQPAFVHVKSAGGDSGVYRPASLAGDLAIRSSGSGTAEANRIQVLQADGFQVGSDNLVNDGGTTYNWVALGDAGYRMTTGTYTGDGTDDRGITSVGFQPDVVFVKANAGASTVCRISSMAGDLSKPMVPNVDATTNRVQSLDAGGFTVGTSSQVNSNGTTYYWTAFKAEAGKLYVGSYVGDSQDNRSIAGVGFQPDYVIVLGEPGDNNGVPYQRFSSMVGDTSIEFAPSVPKSDRIQAFEADGFQLGKNMNVNKSGVTYHYAAWKAIAGQMNVGSYTGDGSDDRSISGVGFKPGYLIIKDYTTPHHAFHRPASLAGDSTLWFTSRFNDTNMIQALEVDGFQLGNEVAGSGSVNNSGDTYHWVAFIDPGAGIPALTLADHDAGQESDAFTQSGSETDAELFGFNLDADGDIIAVTQLVFRLTNISGLTDADWTFGEIVVDDDNNGTIEFSETTTVGGVETVDQAAGTITFPLSFNVLSATNYILRMNFSSLSEGDAVTISLSSADVATAYVESGSTSSVSHAEVTPSLGWMATGTYTGDGTDDRAIIEVGFQPDVVIVKGDAKNPYLRSSTMTGDASKQLISNISLEANHIQSLDADGFTVGNDAEVNQSSVDYYWIAFQVTAGQLSVGTYVGNVADNRSIGSVGFQPDYLIVMSANGRNPIHRSTTMVGDASIRFSNQAMDTDKIQAFESDGFQLGTHNHVNASGDTFHYVAFKAISEQMSVGSYTGDATDDRDIADVGFQPEYLILKGNATINGAHRTSDLVGDSTLDFKNGANYTNGIQALQANGFQIGTDTKVNQSSTTYYWIAFANGAAASTPRIISWTEVDPYYP